jgi:hypothetical protein
MKFVTKSLLSAGAAAAALVGATAPAMARHDNDKISAGEVIAGAVILGGLAAVIAASDNDRDRDRYDNRDYRNDGYDNYHRGGRHDRGRHNRGGWGYNNHGGGRSAVNQCINAVENWASRYSRADVTEIRDIDRTYNGYRVTGKLVVQDGYRGRDRYDRGYDRGYDKGRFTCYVERGRVIDIDYRGLDQWR